MEARPREQISLDRHVHVQNPCLLALSCVWGVCRCACSQLFLRSHRASPCLYLGVLGCVPPQWGRWGCCVETLSPAHANDGIRVSACSGWCKGFPHQKTFAFPSWPVVRPNYFYLFKRECLGKVPKGSKKGLKGKFDFVDFLFCGFSFFPLPSVNTFNALKTFAQRLLFSSCRYKLCSSSSDNRVWCGCDGLSMKVRWCL